MLTDTQADLNENINLVPAAKKTYRVSKIRSRAEKMWRYKQDRPQESIHLLNFVNTRVSMASHTLPTNLLTPI